MRPVGGERAQEVAQPAHTLRVEPVRRLVEDQQLGVAEQRGRQPEPLAHPERVPLDAPARRRVELDQAQHLVHARVGQADGPARASAGGRGPERPGWKSVASSTAPTRNAGSSSSRVGAAEDAARCPLLGLASPSSIRSVVVLPAPFGPRKPVIVPGSSANERESTASTEPNRLVSESATTASSEAATAAARTGSDGYAAAPRSA